MSGEEIQGIKLRFQRHNLYINDFLNINPWNLKVFSFLTTVCSHELPSLVLAAGARLHTVFNMFVERKQNLAAFLVHFTEQNNF